MVNEPATNQRLSDLLETPKIKQKFDEVLTENKAEFVSNLMTVVNGNDKLKTAEPMSIISAAMQAATLHLSILPTVGQAYIVPYNGLATFQMGWKGFVQLALRTQQYKRMNAKEIYEGQLKNYDPITGDFEYDLSVKTSDKVIGYVFFFRLINGFEKYTWMTQDEMEKHAKRYSKSYQYDLSDGKKSSQWSIDFVKQGLKTVVKMGLSKWGPLSTEMKKAIVEDEAVIDIETGKMTEYPDNPLLPEKTTEAPKVTSSRLAAAVAPVFTPAPVPQEAIEQELPI